MSDSNKIVSCQSIEDLNKGFCSLELNNSSIDTGSCKSIYISDSDMQQIYLECSNDESSMMDMSVFRCTSQTVRGLFYNQHSIDESLQSRDHCSFMKMPNSVNDLSGASETNIRYKHFCEELEPENLSSDSGLMSNEGELSNNQILKVNSSERNQSIKVTCKTICSQITSKLLKKFKRKQVEVQSESTPQTSRTVKASNGQQIVREELISGPTALIQNKRVPIKICARSYRPNPARFDDGVSAEVQKSNFNQLGDIVYYYV